MIVRISFIQTDAGKYEEGTRIWDNELAPLLEKQKGFRRAFRAETRDEPGGVILEFWENSEAEKKWRESREYKELARRLRPLVSELPIDRPFVVGNEVTYKP
jgi:heme-degrading monooxygenase HmoA